MKKRKRGNVFIKVSLFLIYEFFIKKYVSNLLSFYKSKRNYGEIEGVI